MIPCYSMHSYANLSIGSRAMQQQNLISNPRVSFSGNHFQIPSGTGRSQAFGHRHISQPGTSSRKSSKGLGTGNSKPRDGFWLGLYKSFVAIKVLLSVIFNGSSGAFSKSWLPINQKRC